MKYKLSILLFLLIFIGIYSCQKATQPNDLQTPIEMKIIVQDQSGNLIKDAEVNVYNKTKSKYSIFKQKTNKAGVVKLSDYLMPINGETMDFYVTPPILGSGFNATGITAMDVFLGCADTTLIFKISIEKDILCGQSDNQDVKIQICNDSTATIYSDIITSSCLEELTLSSSGIMSNVSFSVVDENSDAIISTLSSGDGFRVKADFNPSFGINQNDMGSFNVQGTYSGVLGLDFTLKLRAIAEDCSECDCPSSYTFTNFPAPDTCLNTLSNFTIDSTTIINNNSEENCNYEFELVDGIDENSFTLVQGLNSVLLPGENQSEMIFTFFSETSGTFTDQLIYDVYKRNLRTNNRERCEQVFVNLLAISQGPVCNIIDDSDTSNILTDNNLYQCPSWDESSKTKYVSLENTGSCDLSVDITLDDPNNIFALSEGSNTYTGSTNLTLIIEPKKSIKINIKFLPEKGDLYPNGCQGNKVINYFANLIIDSPEEDGCDRTINLIGNIKEDCTDTQGFKRVEWGQNNNFQYLELSFDKNAAVVTGRVGTNSTTGRDLFVTNVNTNAPISALLNSDNGTFIRLDNRAKGVQSICNWVEDYCNDIGSTNVNTITINENDVILCYINGYHGLISISAIRNDTSDGTGNNAVEFEICYPID